MSTTTMQDVMTAWRAKQSNSEVIELINRMDPSDPQYATARRWADEHGTVSGHVTAHRHLRRI
jgi:hypothetical protein